MSDEYASSASDFEAARPVREAVQERHRDGQFAAPNRDRRTRGGTRASYPAVFTIPEKTLGLCLFIRSRKSVTSELFGFALFNANYHGDPQRIALCAVAIFWEVDDQTMAPTGIHRYFQNVRREGSAQRSVVFLCGNKEMKSRLSTP